MRKSRKQDRTFQKKLGTVWVVPSLVGACTAVDDANDRAKAHTVRQADLVVATTWPITGLGRVEITRHITPCRIAIGPEAGSGCDLQYRRNGENEDGEKHSACKCWLEKHREQILS